MLAAVLALALPLGLVAAAPASAAPSDGAACPAGSNLSLGQVVKLHQTSPDLFAWCR